MRHCQDCLHGGGKEPEQSREGTQGGGLGPTAGGTMALTQMAGLETTPQGVDCSTGTQGEYTDDMANRGVGPQTDSTTEGGILVGQSDATTNATSGGRRTNSPINETGNVTWIDRDGEGGGGDPPTTRGDGPRTPGGPKGPI